MAKKATKQQLAEIDEVEKPEVPTEFIDTKAEQEPEPVEVIDGTHERAESIRQFFPAVADVFNGEFDESNPDHLVIAAFTIGRRGMLRR